jgi:hypothetical protein
VNTSPLARLFASTIADDPQPSDGVKRSCCNYGNWWRAAIIGLLLSLPTVGQAEPTLFTFTRVVDTTTPIPGGTGNFIFFTDPFTTTLMDSRPATSIENGIVVFSGSGPSGQEGMYAAAVGGSITTIADTNTPLPDVTGNFRLFGTPSLSQGNLAFPASDVIGPLAQGAYFAPLGGSIIRTVADRNTPVPGGIGVFRGIGRVSLDDGNVAFGHSSVGKDRIFVADNKGQIQLVADNADFGVFNGLSSNGGIVAFIARQTSIFAASVGNPPVLVVDVTASFPRPGGGTVLTGFNPSTDNGSIAFLVQGNGIYIATLQGTITPVALVGTLLPGGTGNFTGFDSDSPSQRDGIVAFRGFGPSGQEGIYVSIGGLLTKVIDVNDSLNGKTLTHLFLGYEAVSGNQIAFAAQFADGSRGIYVAQAGTTVVIDNCDSEVANTLFPGGRTISDFIGSCAEGARNHGQFVSCVSHLTTELMKAGTITGQQKGAIQSCTAKAHIP